VCAKNAKYVKYTSNFSFSTSMLSQQSKNEMSEKFQDLTDWIYSYTVLHAWRV